MIIVIVLANPSLPPNSLLFVLLPSPLPSSLPSILPFLSSYYPPFLLFFLPSLLPIYILFSSHTLFSPPKRYFKGSINSEEFEELRKVDYEYRREMVMDESEKLKLALDFLGKNIYYCHITVIIKIPKQNKHSICFFLLTVIELFVLRTRIILE